MSTVKDIVAAAAQLDSAEFLLLRQELDRLEQGLWEAEHAATSEEMRQANVTDDAIDSLVLRRRPKPQRGAI